MANISAVEEKNVVSPEGTPPEGKKKKPKPKKKAVKRVVASLVVLATLGGITYGMFRLFHKTEPETRPDTTFVYRGSIMSTVTGNGVTKAEDSKTVMLTAGGKVLEVFVAEGDWVNEGDPLYVIDSAEAQKAVEDAQKGVESAEKTVADIGKQIAKIHESYGDLTVTAPFSGRLRDTPRLQIGDKVAAGTKIATLVDDTQLVLTLYFSYAYEADIYVGQAAVISVPATMSSVPARVREINYVRRITPEGSVLFQVTLEAENPGTLTEEMPASASLSSGGEEIHPYEAGKLENNRTSDVTAKVSGEVLDARLLDYAQVTAGQTLLVLGAEDNDDQLEALQRQLDAANAVVVTANAALEKARDSLDNFNAVSPMDGTVMTCSLLTGETAEGGRAAVTISNTSVMLVDARIDEMNVAYVKPGMYCDIVQWGRNGQENFSGVVDTVSLEGKYENGISYFPAVIRVENPDGSIMPGMYVDYSLVASQSEDCLIVPLGAVKYTEAGTCLFVKRVAPPENALDAEALGLDVPEGFYAVPVTIGLSDNAQAEVSEGIEENDEIFTQYVEGAADGGGGVSGGRGEVVMRVG